MKNMWIKYVLIFSISSPAWGYRLTQDFINGFYWANLPVRFIIQESDANRKAMLLQLSESAIRQWEKDTGFSLWDISSEGTSNIIRWSTNFAAETRMDPETVLAVAIRFTEGPYFAKSEIVINGNHSAFNSPIENMNKINIGTTLVHELGHTLGLDHSENMLAIMAPTLQYPYNGLHTDDIDGMGDALAQTEQRQISRYVSPLAYTRVTETSQPLSCGTTGPVSGQTSGQGLISLALGLLISFVRKTFSWFKSLF